VVACHSKLCALLLYNKIGKVLLTGELVPEAQAIVKKTKANDDLPARLCLAKGYRQLVVLVPDLRYFAPYRFPGFIKGSRFGVCYRKVV